MLTVGFIVIGLVIVLCGILLGSFEVDPPDED